MGHKGREILWAGVAPAVFLLGQLVYYLRVGSCNPIESHFTFPYDMSTLSLGDILLHYDRQPFLWLMYVRLLCYAHLQIFDAVAVGNIALLALTLVLAWFTLRLWLGRAGSLVLCLLLGASYDFFIYALFTSYEAMTAFLVAALLCAHAHAFTVRLIGRAWRLAGLLLAPALAVVLALTRSFYSTFLLPYALLYLGLMLLHPGPRAAVSRRARLGTLALALALLAAPPLVMLKNLHIFGYAGLSNLTYHNFQRVVMFELEEQGRFQRPGEMAEYVAATHHLSPQVKAFYAAGAPWPVLMEHARDLAVERPDLVDLVACEHPALDLPGSLLYRHIQSYNGWPLGLLMRPGFEVALAVLGDDWTDMLPGIARRAWPLTVAPPTHWFMPQCGRLLALDWPGPGRIIDRPQELVPGGPNLKTRARFDLAQFIYRPLISLGLLIQRYLAPLAVAAAALHLIWLGWGMLRGREVDQGLLLVTALICYSVLVSLFGEFPENARFGIYWKTPLFCYLGWWAAQRWGWRAKRPSWPGV